MLKVDKKKFFGSILGILMFMVVVIAFSYAFYAWKGDNTSVTFNISDNYFYCESGIESHIDGLYPVLDYRDGGYQTFVVNNVSGYDTRFSITMEITSIDDVLLTESFKYKLMVDLTGGSNNCADINNNNCVEVGSGDFSQAVVGANTLVPSIDLVNNSKYQYYLFLYIDGNMENDVAMQNGSMTSILDVCEVVVFLEYNGGTGDKKFLKVTDTYEGLPSTVTKEDSLITYNTNGGNTISTDSVSYTFGGWYKDTNFQNSVSASTEVTEVVNHTLYAKWNPSKSITLPTPTKTGYTFDGWYSDVGLTNKIGDAGGTYNPDKSVTLYAKWIKNTYTIAYTLNGGSSGTYAPSTGTYDSDVRISNPTKTVTVTGNANSTGASVGTATSANQTFAGWTTSSSAGLGSNAKTGTTASPNTAWSGSSTTNTYFKNLRDTSGTVTLTANWTAVSFNLPTVSKTGYSCKWNTKSDGSGTNYNSGASYTPSANGSTAITLYAVCTANTYNISYTLNGGTKGSNAPTSATYNNTVTINNPTKTVTVTGNANSTGASVGSATSKAQTFAGWTASNLNTSTAYYGTSSSSVTTAWSNASTKVTAQYFKNLTPTSGATVTLTANWTAVAFNLPTVSKTGYTCKWNTKSDGSGTSYNSGASYTPSTTSSASITMYAVCTVNTYKVSYENVGGTVQDNTNLIASYDGYLNNYNSHSSSTTTWTDLNSKKNGTISNGTWGDNYLSFNGTSTWVDLGQINSEYQTIEVLFSVDSLSTSNLAIVGNWENGGGGLYIDSSGFLHGEFYINSAYQNVSSNISLTVNQIYHAALTYDGNAVILYINGEQVASKSVSGTISVPQSSTIMALGTNPSGSSSSSSVLFDGRIYSVSFYNIALTSSQIASDFGKTVTYGSTYGTLPTPVRTGYTFDGWYLSVTGGSKVTSSTSVTIGSNHSLYARWNANTYNISYTLNGGTKGSNAPTSATYNNTVTINNPTKTVTVTGNANSTGASVGSATSKAQTFAGWTASNLNTSTAYYGTSSSSVTTAWSNSSTKVTAQYFKNLTPTSGATVTLTANWTAVAFNLPTVSKTGYTCKWNTKSDGSGTNYSSGASYTPSTTGSAAVTMYAVCTANTYNISYTLNGGTKGSSAPTSATYDSAVTINNPSKTVTVTGNANGTGASVGGNASKAQTFKGWSSTTINTSTAYYGSTAWTSTSTLVSATSFKNLTPTSGGTVTLVANWTAVALTLPTVSKTGYSCKWNTKSDGSGTNYTSGASYTPSTTGSASVTMYAICTKNTYTIAYTLNGGTKGTNAPTSGTYDTDVQISNPTKTVTVTGNANSTGASVGSATSKAQTFAGWTTSSSAGLGSNAKTGASASPSTAWSGSSTKNTYFRNLRDTSGTVTLTANWTAVALTLPTVSKTGYSCKWNTASDGSGTNYNSGASYTPSANGSTAITMYAICTINNYSLTINPNSGSYKGTTSNTSVTQNYNTTYGLLVPSRTGYSLKNWSLSGSGSVNKGIASGKSTSKAGFTETLKTDSDGTYYTNYSVSSNPTSNTWYSIKYPNYSFTAGHTYKISVWIRVNTLTGGSLSLRHACISNDYNSTGRVALGVSSSAVGKGWIEYTMTRTWDSTTIASSNGSTNVTINPLFEIYTSNLANQTVSMNFDIKNIVITDTTSTSYPYTSDYIYRFGAGTGTLTANYNANTYNISYTLNGGTKGSSAPTSATYDSAVTISNPVKTVTVTGNANGTGASVGSASSKAQTFKGWSSTTINTSTAYYGSTAWTSTSTLVSATSFKNLTPTSGGTVTLVANWTAVNLTLPTVTKTGYTCKWNTASDGSGTSYNSGGSYTPSTTGSASVTMYAVCTKNTYTIAYTLNGGTKGTNAPTSGTYDTDVQISNPTKTVTVTGNANSTGASVGSATSKAQTFAGWTTSSSAGLGSNAKTGTSASPSTAWSGTSTKNTYFRNLRDTSGTVTLTANWTAVALTLPTVSKTGYTCKWNTKSDGSGTSYNSGASYTPSSTSSSSVTMYAVCTGNNYTITYDYNYLPNDKFDTYYNTGTFNSCCGSGSVSSSKITNDTSDGRIITVTSTNQGWYFSSKTKLTVGTTYTWSFDAKASTALTASIGSEQNGSKTISVGTSWQRYTYTFTAGDTSHSAFVFYDWYSSSSRTLYIRNLQIQEGNLYTKSSTLKCGDALGDSGGTPTRVGYTFLGWYTDPIGGTKVTTSTSVPAANTTYYAHWKANQVIVQYNANGGSWAGSSDSTLSLDSSGYVTLNGSRNVYTMNYGTAFDLANYNNSGYINISKSGYVAKSGAQWICASGCTTANKTFNQDTKYASTDYCDASNGDCTVVLNVNWVAASLSISSSKVTGGTTPCGGGQAYRYNFTINIQGGSLSSGKMCFAGSSSSHTSYCSTYATNGSNGYGCAWFYSATSWSWWRSNYCVWAYATSSYGKSAEKYQC